MRRLLIILIVLILLLGGAAIAAHLVLTSDTPRQIAISTIEQRTGMRAEIESLEITWGGRAEIRGLRLTTPLENEPFLSVDSLHATMRALPLIAITGEPGLQRVEIDDVHLALRQHPDGQWNVLELLGRTQGDDQPGTPPTPPQIVLRNARLTVEDAQGRHTALESITLTGEPLGAAAFTFDASAHPGLAASGRIDLRGDFRHRVQFSLENIRELAHDWLADRDLPEGDLSLNGHWSGQVDDGEVTGRLAVNRIHAGPLTGQGVLQVNAGADGLGVSVQQWVARLPETDLPGVRLTGGRIELVGDEFLLRRVAIDVMQTQAWVTGRWSLTDQRGEAQLSWSGRMPEFMNLAHDGEATLELTPVTPTRQRITATIHSEGSIEAGRWNADATLTGAGPNPQNMTWQFRLPRAAWEDDQRTVQFDDTAFNLITDLPTITLQRLRLAGHPLTGALHADTDHRTWHADLATRNWLPPALDLPAPLDFNLRAEGNVAQTYIRDLSLQTQNLQLQASGEYIHGIDHPLTAHFHAVARHAVPPDAPDQPLPPDAESVRFEKRFAGRASVRGSVQGALAPLDLTITDGLAQLDHLILNHQRMHDIAAPFTAAASQQRVTLHTPDDIALLNGAARLRLGYAWDTSLAEAALRISDIDLARAAVYANPSLDVGGTLDAALAMNIPERDLSRLRAAGDWQAANLRVGELARVDAAEGELSTSRSLLILDPITLRLEDGVAEGRAEYDLLDARTLRAQLNVDNWPLDLDDYQLATRVEGDVALNVDVIDQQVAGRVNVGADVDWRGRHAGHVLIDGGLFGRTLSLDRVESRLLDGYIEGDATLHFDDLYATTATFRWQDINLALVEPWLDAVDEGDLHGAVTGNLHVLPAQLARAPEPLQIEFSLDPGPDAAYRTITLGSSTASIFLGPERIALQDSLIGVADGRIRARGQFVPRNANRWFLHARAELERLDINLLNRFIDPEAEAIVGRLGGRGSAYGFIDDLLPDPNRPPSRPRTFAGDGTLRLTESDLADTRIMGALYDVMALSLGGTDPTGAGRLRFRVDGGSLHIDEFQYFNRGVDALGQFTIAEIAAGADSPLEGTLIGAYRPLRGVQLPFAADLDRLLRSVQSIAGSIRVDGTVREPNPRPASLADIESTIERLLGPQQRE